MGDGAPIIKGDIKGTDPHIKLQLKIKTTRCSYQKGSRKKEAVPCVNPCNVMGNKKVLTLIVFYGIIEYMMKKKTYNLNNVFEKVAKLGGSLGSPARLKILYLIAQAPRSVETISDFTGEKIGNTSQHLQKLLNEGLVVVRKEKLQRIYSLKNEKVADLIENLFDLHECLSDNETEIDNVASINGILEEIKNQKAFLVDVRDVCETKETPVPNALKIPIEELEAKVKELDKNKTYYLFCRGRACSLAKEGLKIFESAGLRAIKIKDSPITLRKILTKE